MINKILLEELEPNTRRFLENLSRTYNRYIVNRTELSEKLKSRNNEPDKKLSPEDCLKGLTAEEYPYVCNTDPFGRSEIVDGKIVSLNFFQFHNWAIEKLKDYPLDKIIIPELDGIDFSLLPDLKKLHIRHIKFGSLDLAMNTALEELECPTISISKLDLTGMIELKILRCGNNKIDRLNLTNNLKLEKLDCSYTEVSTIDITRNILLVDFTFSGIPLNDIDLSQNTELRSLSTGKMDMVNLESNIKLEYLDCRSLKKVNITHLKKLKKLIIGDTEYIDLSGNINLEELQGSSGALIELDITANRKLRELYASSENLTMIRCTEAQAALLPLLRKKAKLKLTPEQKTAINIMALHEKAKKTNWDFGSVPLRKILNNPLCDLGTALMIYWLGQPYQYLKYRKVSEVPNEYDQRTMFRFIKKIEDRVINGDFENRVLAWDPSDYIEELTDRETVKHVRKIPKEMFYSKKEQSEIPGLSHEKKLELKWKK